MSETHRNRISGRFSRDRRRCRRERRGRRSMLIQRRCQDRSATRAGPEHRRTARRASNRSSDRGAPRRCCSRRPSRPAPDAGWQIDALDEIGRPAGAHGGSAATSTRVCSRGSATCRIPNGSLSSSDTPFGREGADRAARAAAVQSWVVPHRSDGSRDLRFWPKWLGRSPWRSDTHVASRFGEPRLDSGTPSGFVVSAWQARRGRAQRCLDVDVNLRLRQ